MAPDTSVKSEIMSVKKMTVTELSVVELSS